ncbi:MAG: hypothetical protein ACI4RT_05730 [Candidatus Spyradenecus sp.]
MNAPMCRILFLCLLLTALASGCRQEDWRTVELPLPEGVAEAEAVAAVVALDWQTPPEVTLQAHVLHIRYNSLRVAPMNFRYALQQLAQKPQPGSKEEL